MIAGVSKESVLLMGKTIIKKFNQELDKKNAEIAALEARVVNLEEQMNEVYNAWARYNCCGRYD